MLLSSLSFSPKLSNACNRVLIEKIYILKNAWVFILIWIPCFLLKKNFLISLFLSVFLISSAFFSFIFSSIIYKIPEILYNKDPIRYLIGILLNLDMSYFYSYLFVSLIMTIFIKQNEKESQESIYLLIFLFLNLYLVGVNGEKVKEILINQYSSFFIQLILYYMWNLLIEYLSLQENHKEILSFFLSLCLGIIIFSILMIPFVFNKNNFFSILIFFLLYSYSFSKKKMLWVHYFIYLMWINKIILHMSRIEQNPFTTFLVFHSQAMRKNIYIEYIQEILQKILLQVELYKKIMFLLKWIGSIIIISCFAFFFYKDRSDLFTPSKKGKKLYLYAFLTLFIYFKCILKKNLFYLSHNLYKIFTSLIFYAFFLIILYFLIYDIIFKKKTRVSFQNTALYDSDDTRFFIIYLILNNIFDKSHSSLKIIYFLILIALCIDKKEKIYTLKEKRMKKKKIKKKKKDKKKKRLKALNFTKFQTKKIKKIKRIKHDMDFTSFEKNKIKFKELK